MNLEALRQSGRITAIAISCGKNACLVDATEIDVANRVDEVIRERGAINAFETMVSFGVNTANVHHTPTDKVISRGDIVMIDAGACYKGYSTDCTTTHHMRGTEPKEWDLLRKVISSFKEACEAKAVFTRSLDGLHEAFDIFAKPAVHCLGHFIDGDIIHAKRKYKGELKIGDVFTIEPGIYLKGKFGIRFEDTYLVHEDGFENLTDPYWYD